ncbi:RNA polymerase sigma factor [Kitasatospora sp. NPDC088346]|uniref:RNA polymerase sigma factor n=1 Tax=Kitasatospora sp. NPDC088346 TaxID=3364073 RepID=UPI003815E10B
MAVLYARHHRATLAHARSLGTTAVTAEDLASEAFTCTLAAVRSGSGPTGSWRPYLLRVVRNTAAAWASAERRTLLTPDVGLWADRNSPVLSPDQILVSAVELDLVLAGYDTLPDRWRAALRYSVVEERPTEEVARLLGLTASGASSLVARAHEGLRQAYLAAHLRGTTSAECLAYTDQLKPLARRPARRKSRLLIRHLEDCAQCRHCYEEMREVNQHLRLAGTALLGPVPVSSDGAEATAAEAPVTVGTASVSCSVDAVAEDAATAAALPRVGGSSPAPAPGRARAAR